MFEWEIIMTKSICLTQKRIRNFNRVCKNIDPAEKKAKSIAKKLNNANLNVENRRFSKTNKNKKILEQQVLATPQFAFWGTATDIDI